MFGNVPAVGNTRVASPDISNHELDDESAGQIFVSDNLVPKSGGNTDDESQALTDVHSDPVDDLGSHANESSVLSQVESFENVNNSEHNKSDAPRHLELSPEQTDVVEQACQAMSTAQREHAVTRLQAKNAKSSHGKAVNPRNWGVANLAQLRPMSTSSKLCWMSSTTWPSKPSMNMMRNLRLHQWKVFPKLRTLLTKGRTISP